MARERGRHLPGVLLPQPCAALDIGEQKRDRADRQIHRRPNHGPSGQRILCEVLGFWSRDALFRRIELARRGLSRKTLFLASSRLRVSEELFDGMEESALYVYKGKVNVRTLLRRLEGML